MGYRLTNTGNSSLRFLPWDTAIADIGASQFEVRHDDVLVAYVGPNVVFAEPREEHFLELRPGESLSTTIQLSDLYDIAEPGVYTVRALPRALSRLSGDRSDPPSQLMMEGADVAISIDADHVRQPSEVGSLPAEVEKALQPTCLTNCQRGCNGDPIFAGQCFDQCEISCNPRPSCDAAEDTSLNGAVAEARRLLQTAISSINPPATSTLRQVYLDYFGIRVNARMNEVNRVLTGARTDVLSTNRQRCFNVGQIPTGTGTFGCDGPGVTGITPIIAITNGSLGLNVGYCPAFFANPFTGVARSLRARTATVVHEAAHHFGAQDIRDLSDGLVNSAAQAQALAANDPAAAVASAVNYSTYVTDRRFP